MEFIWIASFPKSGNTWLRFICTYLLYGFVSDKSEINHMIPDMHLWTGGLKYQWKGANTVKTHLPYTRLPDRLEFRKAIYIARHPLDVVASAVEYMAPAGLQDEKKELMRQFVEHRNLTHWDKLYFEAWDENVMSWKNAASTEEILFLRYEDMLADPKGYIRQISDFLEADADEKIIDKVAAETSFEVLQSLEKDDRAGNTGFFVSEQIVKHGEFTFMRSGQQGRYRDVLDEESIQKISDHFAPTMEVLGYTTA